MSNLIDNIVKEWSYSVESGMPDVNNPLHLIRLKSTLYEMNYKKTFIEGLLNSIQNIQEVDCKRGERSDLTGCTPESGIAGTAKKEPTKISKAKAEENKKFDDSIAKIEDQEKRKKPKE